MNQKIFFFIALFFPIVNACGKSNENNPPVVDIVELITKDKWTTYDNLVDKNSSGNFISATSACNKDDIWAFAPDGKGGATDGPEACDPDLPLALVFDWNLKENNTVLVISFNANGVVYDEIQYSIVSVTENKLELLRTKPDPSPSKSKIVLTR